MILFANYFWPTQMQLAALLHNARHYARPPDKT